MLRTALTLVVVVLLAAPAAAQEKKPGGLRDFPFWTGPKQPHARAFAPGLQAALQLTPEQCERIEAACRETIDKPENRGKNNPGAAAATDKLHQMVGEVLTPEQKKLIEKINDAYGKAAAEAGEEFQPLYAASKGNAEETAKLREQQRAAVAENFQKRLDAILTPEQKKAVAEAAAAIKKQEENKKKK
jgi:hypothetical protein